MSYMECAHCAPVVWEVSSSSDCLQDGPSKGLELWTGNKTTNDLWAHEPHSTWPLPGAGAGQNCWLRVQGGTETCVIAVRRSPEEKDTAEDGEKCFSSSLSPSAAALF